MRIACLMGVLAFLLTTTAVAALGEPLTLFDVTSEHDRTAGFACSWVPKRSRGGTGDGQGPVPPTPRQLTLRVSPDRVNELPYDTQALVYLAGPPELLKRILHVEYVWSARAASTGRRQPPLVTQRFPVFPDRLSGGSGLATWIGIDGATPGKSSIQATVVILTARGARTVVLSVVEPSCEAIAPGDL